MALEETIRRYRGLLVLAGIFFLAIFVSPQTSQGGSVFLSIGNLTDMLRAISPITIIHSRLPNCDIRR